MSQRFKFDITNPVMKSWHEDYQSLHPLTESHSEENEALLRAYFFAPKATAFHHHSFPLSKALLKND